MNEDPEPLMGIRAVVPMKLEEIINFSDQKLKKSSFNLQIMSAIRLSHLMATRLPIDLIDPAGTRYTSLPIPVL